MRPRSGGIHSSSERQYIQLADIAQQCKSLFYDEPKISPNNKRRKYAFAINASKIQIEQQAKNKEKVKNVSKAFDNFNFDQQSYNFQKDCESLKKIEEERKKKIIKNNFTILSNLKTSVIYQLLQKYFGVEQQNSYCQDRVINLYINRYLDSQDETFIDCFWIIDLTHSNNFNALFEVYISRSVEILDLGSMQGQQSEMGADLLKQIERMVSKIREKRRSKPKNEA